MSRRADVAEFLAVAADIPIRPEVEEYRLEDANTALVEIKERRIRGAKVLRVSDWALPAEFPESTDGGR